MKPRILPPIPIIVLIVALVAAGLMQHHVEERRIESKLTWTNTESKEALEVGFLALGGFRGLLADVLWFKAQTQQDSSHYYELKMMCDLIQKLQPTFTQVHAFQAYNMSYNLATHAENCEDKWYWVRSGVATLEKGLERTRQNYNLWFELGYQYFDRLGNIKMEDCKSVRDRELPNIDELTEEQCDAVFSKPKTWTSGHARPDENYRFAAYYFWKSIETKTEKNPLRTERIYGECLEHLGMWFAKGNKPVSEWKKWSDGGMESWYVELRRRNNEDRQMEWDQTVPELLRWCMYEEIVVYTNRSNAAAAVGDLKAVAENSKNAADAYTRFKQYFPEDTMTMEKVIADYNNQMAKLKKFGGKP
jgi:hypothetical protein